MQKYSSKVAVNAVLRATYVARTIQKELDSNSIQIKIDDSPVTVADYSVQGIILNVIGKLSDGMGNCIVAEEDESELLESNLKSKVHHWISVGFGGSSTYDGVNKNNKSNNSETNSSNDYWWTLDPIDGTKGFIRKNQFAICLALMRGSEPILSILSCPNLAFPSLAGLSPEREEELIVNPLKSQPLGSLFIAAAGEGSYQTAIPSDEVLLKAIEKGDAAVDALVEKILDEMEKINVSDKESRFCESVEKGHSDQSVSAKALSGIFERPPLRMDSQCKYGCVARGDCSLFARKVTNPDYQEKVWDHAAGVLLVREAGGFVSNAFGSDISFIPKSRTLASKGITILAGVPCLKNTVIKAFSSQL